MVEEVAAFIPIPENETTALIQQDLFAVAVMEVPPQSDLFLGHDFGVDLGMRFDSESEDDLILNPGDITFERNTEATASLSISSNFFETPSVRDAISSSVENANMSEEFVISRIINSAFLRDVFFTRINISTDANYSVTTAPVGGIILSSTLALITMTETREVRVIDIDPPITLTFRKKQSLASNSNTSCNFWDFEENSESITFLGGGGE